MTYFKYQFAIIFRLLREALDNGSELFTPEGNLNRIGYEYLPRYDTHYDRLSGLTTEEDDIASD